MAEYDALVEQLRYCATHDCMYDGMEEVGCTAPYEEREECTTCSNTLMVMAAEAIEELTEERKKGEWIPYDVDFDVFYRCSNCGYDGLPYPTNFCQDCGADMREKNK